MRLKHLVYKLKFNFSVSVILLLLAANLFGQNPSLDSMLNVLKKSENDSNKVQLMIELSKKVEDTAKKSYYLNAAIILSRQLKYPRGEASAETLYGYYYIFKNVDYAKAVAHYTEALKIYKSINDQRGIAVCYHQLGVISMNFRDFGTAKSYFMKSVAINRE